MSYHQSSNLRSQSQNRVPLTPASQNPFGAYQHRLQQNLQLYTKPQQIKQSQQIPTKINQRGDMISRVYQISPQVNSCKNQHINSIGGFQNTQINRFNRDKIDIDSKFEQQRQQTSHHQHRQSTLVESKGVPFWGTSYGTFFNPQSTMNVTRNPPTHSFSMTSRDINTAAKTKYHKYKAKPIQPQTIDYNKVKEFTQYLNNLNYQENKEDPIYRNTILRKSLDTEKRNTIEGFEKVANMSCKNRPASAAKISSDNIARVFSPMTKFKKDLERNKIQSKWRMSAYRSYIKGF